MNFTRVLTATIDGGQPGDHDGLSPPVPWWSLTKTVLAAGALALVATGRLALDAPLGSKPFPLRQLLQHTAGLGQGPGSVAAVYHFPDLDPPRTAAAFAPVEDQALVERAVLAL